MLGETNSPATKTRRIVLNTWIAGCMALCVASTAMMAQAATSPMAFSIALSQSVVAQANNAGAQRQQLLSQARTALRKHDYAEATRLANEADKFQVEVDPVLAAYQDSPARIRADVARLQSQAGGGLRPVNAAPGSGSLGAVGPMLLPSTEDATSPPSTAVRNNFLPGNNELPRSNASTLPPQLGAAREQALGLIARVQLAMDQGDYAAADRFNRQAMSLNVPDNLLPADQPRPQILQMQIDRELSRRGVIRARYDNQGYDNNVAQGVYRPGNDPTYVQPAQATETSPAQGSQFGAQAFPPVDAAPIGPRPTPGNATYALTEFKNGMKAAAERDREKALGHFTNAWNNRQQLDPLTRQALQDQLNVLNAAASAERSTPSDSPLQRAVNESEVLRQKLYRELTQERTRAEKMREDDPRGALAQLTLFRGKVAEAQIDAPVRRNLLAAVDRSIEEMQTYISRNKAQIASDERNDRVREDIENDRLREIEKQNGMAALSDDFNKLMREQRYAEAVVIAKQARELDPNSEIAELLIFKATFAYRIQSELKSRERYEEGFLGQLDSVRDSSIPFDDRTPFILGDIDRWEDITRRRRAWLEREHSRYSPNEMRIKQALAKPVNVKFNQRPLGEVMATLSDIAGVNIFLDPQGMAAEGATSASVVTLELREPISLESALNLILQQHSLGYVIQNEVLRITSEQIKETDLQTEVYYVADLVVPIPNFTPSYNMGVPAALARAYQMAGHGQHQNFLGGGTSPVMLADTGAPNQTSASVLAQLGGSGLNYRGAPLPEQGGPGGMGGGVQADFDSLINLISSTIAPETWDEVGGPGSLSGFDTNLSLVVSNTQDVHEQIADLLEQLRRLQDLQVTIEVRFVTLNDNFFERIGIDFDFDIDDNTGGVDIAALDDQGPSVSLGLDATGAPTADLDFSFTQNSFGTAIPPFGPFDAASAANFGFAILSDIEVFFVLQAAQGDTRNNVMQAPKVTLFNGQQAFISDTSQTPFVTSVVPVVGDFAAAHQPVVMVLSEGMSLSVQAVVSNDRRFVRLTLVPFFSSIGDVQEFTFNAKTTQTQNANGDQSVSTEGTTIQLPQFTFTTVTTTVSVPDGGTVLMGGIKRLSEGRNERGVPILSKLPYVNRLFKNVGIGRTTQSLMMMVTPRIIIQEEEEERTVGRPLGSP